MVGIAGWDDAHITLDDDGLARVWTTLPAIGQGTETTFAQLAADAIGVDVDRVVVKPVLQANGHVVHRPGP